MTAGSSQTEASIAQLPVLAGVGVVIPTCNAARHWPALHEALTQQGVDPEQVLIIDSSSSDQTRALARHAGYRVIQIAQRDFSHGGTRQLAADNLPLADVLVYLTQDAVPADNSSFSNLCAAFVDREVGAAYGRQLPRPSAGPIERHARIFNYPENSNVRTYECRHQLGIKTAFLSNSFAAYRRSALMRVGGFPADVIMAEDSLVAARMLLAGLKVAYVADATVVHSHPLSIKDEFCRYFDTGVHHTREQWILDSFGEAGEEGKRFLRSELHYLLANSPGLLPVAALRTLSKFVAYRLGRLENRLALPLKLRLSAQSAFWHRSHTGQSGKSLGCDPVEPGKSADASNVPRSPALTFKR